MRNIIFTPGTDSGYLILVNDVTEEEYLIENLAVSPHMIERFNPGDTLQSRMDKAIPSKTNLLVWNYFNIPHGGLSQVLEKTWTNITIYAVYLDWLPAEWSFLSSGSLDNGGS